MTEKQRIHRAERRTGRPAKGLMGDGRRIRPRGGLHTDKDCDESCSGCPECYLATGDTACDRTCAHAR